MDAEEADDVIVATSSASSASCSMRLKDWRVEGSGGVAAEEPTCR